MSIDIFPKIKHCVKEVIFVSTLLSVEKCSFYQRTLSRMIILRLPDFIKYSQQLNNASILQNKKDIKNSLSALDNLYKEFLKTQRDKFSGHFQDMDFGIRIDIWSQIDFTKIDFFTGNIKEIYAKFSFIADYEDFSSIVFDVSALKTYSEISHKLNIEDGPRISTDILGITRKNTSAIIPSCDIHDKLSTLNSMELIIKYEFEIFSSTNFSENFKYLFCEMMVVDVTSFIDNLITRTVSSGAKQELDGLDKLLDNTNFPNAASIISTWKSTYKYEITVNKYREIRNKIGAHIDENSKTADLMALVDALDLNEFTCFLKNLIDLKHKICISETILRTFAIGSKRIFGFSEVENHSKPFGENPSASINNHNDFSIKEIWEMWYANVDREKARALLFNLVIETRDTTAFEIEIDENAKNTKKNIYFRKIHWFLYDKLIGTYSQEEKIAAFELIQALSTTDPGSLMLLLLKAYKKLNKILKSYWLYFIGEVGGERIVKVIDILKNNCRSRDFLIRYNSILALLKIDLKTNGVSYQNNGQNINVLGTSISSFLQEYIYSMKIEQQIAFSLALLSEIDFNLAICHLKYSSVQYAFLCDIIINSADGCLRKFINRGLTEIERNNIVDSFSNKRYVASALFIGELLKDIQPEISRFFLEVGSTLINISNEDTCSIWCKARIKCELGEIESSIEIMLQLVSENPENALFKIELLSLYSDNNKEDEYTMLKKDITNNYVLSDDQSAYIIEIEKGHKLNKTIEH